MCSDHATSIPIASANHHGGGLLRGRKRHMERNSLESHSLDLEKDGMAISSTSRPPSLDLSHYKLVEEVWHYCSVDWSNKCTVKLASLMDLLTALLDLCIGYNSLSDTKADLEHRGIQADDGRPESTKHVRDKPKGARTWTWVCAFLKKKSPVVDHSTSRDT